MKFKKFINNVTFIFVGVELLRSKFMRSTQKLHFRSTENDLSLKVDIEEALGQQKMTFDPQCRP